MRNTASKHIHSSHPSAWRALFVALFVAAGFDLRAEGSGFVLVNLLPVAQEMALSVNGTKLGMMRAGVATGPLQLRAGNNDVTLSWGEDERAEGSIEAKPGVTSIVVVHPTKQTAADGSDGKRRPAYAFTELPSGNRVQEPQFFLYSGLSEPTNLVIDGQPMAFSPFAAKRVGGTSGRITIARGEEVLLDLDANPPACLDGPMRWYFFAVGGGEDGSVKVLPVPDFKHDW
jgi:hypothetical protein